MTTAGWFGLLLVWAVVATIGLICQSISLHRMESVVLGNEVELRKYRRFARVRESVQKVLRDRATSEIVKTTPVPIQGTPGRPVDAKGRPIWR